MAASVTTTATTLEGQIFELVQKAQTLELAIPEADRPNNAGIDPDFETLTVSLTVTLPITYTTGAAGQMSIVAAPYLV